MFSPAYSLPHLSLFSTQSSSFLSTQLTAAPTYKKQFQKTEQTHSKTNNTHCKNNPFVVLGNPSRLIDNYPSYTPPTLPNGLEVDISVLVNNSAIVGQWLQSAGNVKEVKRIHAIVLRYFRGSDVFVSNNLISKYAKYGMLGEARYVFDKMLQRSVVSWTAMLNGYLKFGLEDDALKLFIEFCQTGIGWNAKTFVCALNLCGKVLDVELGKQVHACILKGGFSGLILESALVYFYVQCGDIGNAFRVFNTMKKRDVISWTTMISACSQYGRGEEAFVLFSNMLAKGFEPNEFTVCSVLDACGEEKELKLGQQLHGAIVKTMYRMDIFVGTSLVDMYAKCGKMEDSVALFERMRKRNMVTWTSLIAGYARNGFGKQAIKYFRLMQRRRILANNLTMVSILRACGLVGLLPMGKEVHARIFRNQVQSNIYIGSALVWLYCRCGDYSSASKVLQDMPLRDVVSWTSLISGCARLGHEHEALEYLKEMLGDGVNPNPFTYSSALKACAQLEDIKHGKLIHSSINKTPALSNVFVGSALIHMYAKCGHLSEAVRVFHSMPAQNLVSLKAMIIAYAKNGQCREAFKLMYRMQAEGVELGDHVLSTVLTACGDFEWDVDSVLKPDFDTFNSSTSLV